MKNYQCSECGYPCVLKFNELDGIDNTPTECPFSYTATANWQEVKPDPSLAVGQALISERNAMTEDRR
jgi:hypothetical protein